MILKAKYGGKYLGKVEMDVDPDMSEFYQKRETPYEIKFLINNERIFHEFEFVNFLYEKTSLLSPTSFILAVHGNSLYIFNRVDPKQQLYTEFLRYDFPGDNSKQFWLRVLDCDEDEYCEVYLDSLNHHRFITAPKILAVMMKYYELLDRGEVPYREARIRSKNGKIRDIIVPHEEIKIELKSLNTSFQNIFDGRNIGFQVAYKKGKNVLSNAIIHKDNPYIFKLDLKDFFPSCNKELLSQKIEFLFSSSYNYRIVMDEFFKTTLHKDALFIGSPISGTLANYCMANAAGMIRGIAAKNNVEFSIYADDMTFSSERFISEDYVNGIINYVFEELRLENTFKLNTKKSTGQSKNRRHITGVSFNDNNEPTSARAISRFIRTGIYRVEKGGCVDKQVLKGKIQYALSIEGLSGKVATILKKYEKTVLKEKFLSKTQEEKIFAK